MHARALPFCWHLGDAGGFSGERIVPLGFQGGLCIPIPPPSGFWGFPRVVNASCAVVWRGSIASGVWLGSGVSSKGDPLSLPGGGRAEGGGMWMGPGVWGSPHNSPSHPVTPTSALHSAEHRDLHRNSHLCPSTWAGGL